MQKNIFEFSEQLCKVKRASLSSSGASLDDLPDEIVHSIINFLPLKDIARFSTSSRRCRKLCASVPCLNINLLDNNLSLTARERLVNFIDRLMLQRSSFKLQSFNLSWASSGSEMTRNEEYRVESWLHQVARCNVEKLDLTIFFRDPSKTFALPLSFDNCASFKHLKIYMNNKILKLPTARFDCLQLLSLINVQINNESFGEWLSSCKSLSSLYLTNLKGVKNLNISSTCLRRIEIINVHNATTDLSTINISACRLMVLRLHWVSSRTKKLMLSGTNVVLLMLEGDLNCDYHLGSLNSLKQASIYAQTNPRLFSNNVQASTSRILHRILQSVRHAKILCLNIVFVKLLFTESFPRTALHNVVGLGLQVSPNGYDVPLIASILSIFPNLVHLSLRSFFESAAHNDLLTNSSTEESYNPKSLQLGNLKWAFVRLTRKGEHDALEFVEYILKNSKALEKITITYSPEEYRQPSEITRRIQAFRKASCIAAVHLLPRVVNLGPRENPFHYFTYKFKKKC